MKYVDSNQLLLRAFAGVFLAINILIAVPFLGKNAFYALILSIISLFGSWLNISKDKTVKDFSRFSTYFDYIYTCFITLFLDVKLFLCGAYIVAIIMIFTLLLEAVLTYLLFNSRAILRKYKERKQRIQREHNKSKTE